MDNLNYKITENEEIKQLTSEDYNYVYNKDIKVIMRWGKTKYDSPIWAPFGPDFAIVDIQDMSMELFTIILSIINANRTLVIINLLNVSNKDDKYKIQYCLDSGIYPIIDKELESEEEAGFFSLYVDNNGNVKPISSYNEGINIMQANNLYTDIWQSALFKQYRWEQLQRRV